MLTVTDSISDSYNVYSSNSGGDADGGRQRAVRRRST
jgi:hypothetical protein